MIQVSSTSQRDICIQQKAWVDKLSRITIRPVKLAHTWMDGITPGKRLFAYEWHFVYPYQYRECLINELPYDLDVHNYEALTIMLQPTLDFLDSEKIPYYMSGSGGTKSIHIQIFFVPPYAYCLRYSWKAVRFALFEWILEQAEIPLEMIGNGKRDNGTNYPYDISVANFSDTAQARVMRDYGGERARKNRKTLITSLPQTREEIYNGHVHFPDKIELWNPKKIMRDLEFDYNLKYPSACIYCPVDPDHLIQFEEQDPDNIHNHPYICRICGNWKEEESMYEEKKSKEWSKYGL